MNKDSLVYSSRYNINLIEYGILIPLVNSRARMVFNKLNINNEFFETVQNIIITKDDLLRVHTLNYVNSLYDNELLNFEIMKTYELISNCGKANRYNQNNAILGLEKIFPLILGQVSLTYVSMKKSLKYGFSFHLGGGMHHARSYGGFGFCLVNDIVISLKKIFNEKLIKSAWIIDVDAHFGDGTSEICSKESNIKTFSIHMKSGWPLNKEFKEVLYSSDMDVEVDFNDSKNYNKLLKKGLISFIDLNKTADIVIVVNGADPYEGDELPGTRHLSISKNEMLKRDLFLYKTFESMNIPQCYLMAGGYGETSHEIYYQFLKKIY